MLYSFALLLFFLYNVQSLQSGYIRRRLSTIEIPFSVPGAFNFTIPSGVSSLTVTLEGACGGPSNTASYNALGGIGGSITANVVVVPGEVLQITVGGRGTKGGAAGYNGGGTSCSLNAGGSGGGATDIRRMPFRLEDRLVIAGGGGGSSSANNGAFPGGNGGYPNGGSSSTSTGGSGNFYGGEGSTPSSGGAGGNTCSPGSMGYGANCCIGFPGGAGGGGRYGGGAGSASGGGGGSSYAVSGMLTYGDATTAGDGTAVIYYELTPTADPSVHPTRNPTITPSVSPTSQPSSQPSSQPVGQPTDQPSSRPSSQPSKQPIRMPSSQPTRQPTYQPSGQPSTQPTAQPTHQPSQQPSAQPSLQPSIKPTGQPTRQPSVQPSQQPSSTPSSQPSNQPTGAPTTQPSSNPTTMPSSQPSVQPSSQPTTHPTHQPSFQPITQPSSQPTVQPSVLPTAQPSLIPSTQPTSQPTQQPTIQPSSRRTDQPTYQPASTPTAQPSSQPSARPTVQPVSIPSAQPSSAPSTQPTGSPSVCPSLQPSMQPSGQPSTQPYAHPTAQPSLQPSTQPTAQPSQRPLSWPTGVPTLSPTINNGEWSIVIHNTTHLHTIARVDNTTWVCSTERYTCTVLHDAVSGTLQSLKVSVKYTFVTGPVSSVITAIDVDGIMIVDKNTATVTSSLSKCTYAAVQTTDLICKTTTFSNANFVDATFNTAASRVLYIGTVGTNVAASVIDPNLGTTRGYYYTTDKANSIYLQHATSLSDYFSSFSAGTCVDVTNSAKNNIIAGWIRIDSGAMGAMIVKPQSGYFRNKADLVTCLLGYSVGPDLLIAGGIELNTEVGINGYFLRVNSIFRTFSYARLLRHRVQNRRLNTLLDRFESVVRGMVMDGAYICMIVDKTVISAVGNYTSLSVLEVDPISGNIVQQVTISAANISIFCTDITTTTVGFIIMCRLYNLDTPSSQLLLSVDRKLTFSKLPPGFTRSEESIFYTESIALTAIDAQMNTVSAIIPSTSYSHTIRASSTQTQSPTRQPTASITKHPTEKPTILPSCSPTQYRSSHPSGQPSSSPTAKPSVSPQPTSQPSTASPTVTHKPTRAPSMLPTVSPMVQPTALPSVSPTIQSTLAPTLQPSKTPTIMLTVTPSIRPSADPSLLPTRQPTTDPTNIPSLVQSPFATIAPILLNTSDAGVYSNNNNNNVPNYLIGVTIVGAVVVLLGVCCCYHRYKAKQKVLILTQVVPSTIALTPDSPALNTEATYLKLSAAISIRSSSFTVSSLHSSECSSDHEFSQSLDSDSVINGMYRSESSLLDDDGDVYGDEDEMKSTGSCEESSQFSASDEGDESVHSNYYSA